ncbi:MAG: chitobiase/beta-hexosaminidase C-terminal domain-containing protein [Phycisphaerae bacterium]|nr:chitobiase/beta-hexosaminidase C-terminal domain-containing protein [Phycisphaerae bacterium]
MMRRDWVVGAVAIACLAFATTVVPADEAPALELKPCTIELVDGTTVKGKLAVQFEMDDHLIVYSPRLATVRSFLKDHVHALTVDDKRTQLNAKRALTDADRTLLGQVAWPDEPPATDRKPAYTTETWTAPKRLLVWAEPGESGRLENPENWLINGRQMTDWPRPTGEHYGFIFFQKGNVDFLFPAAADRYVVRPRGTNARTRHITVESGANAEISLNVCTGNLWVSEHGSFYGGGGANLGGDKHTFFVNGPPTATEPPATAERFAALMKSAKGFARKWVVRKDDPAASMTLIGSFGSGDETHWLRGITILEDNSVIAIGPRCVQTVGYQARLILKSGAVLGKNHSQLYKGDMWIKGDLWAGTPDEPLRRNCYLGISVKDSQGRIKDNARRYGAQGLMVMPGANMRVHVDDADSARLVVTWHGTQPGGDDGGSGTKIEQLPEAERTINATFYGATVLKDVVFDRVGKGDIRLFEPDVRRKWGVALGEHVTAPAEQVYTAIPATEELTQRVAKWRKEREARTGDRTPSTAAAGKGHAYLRILPSGGIFAAGDTVAVRLHALGDRKIRYTTDGGDCKKGNVYTGPFELTETTTVTAGCYHHPGPHFNRSWARIEETFTFTDDVRAADDPGDTQRGLKLRVYEAESLDKLHGEPGEPVHTQTVDQFALKVPEGRTKKPDGYVYTGYIAVDEPGIYRFYTRTEGASRLYLGDRLVVDNDRRYRYDWKPTGKAPLESWGSLRLEPGTHAIRVEYLRGRGFAWWKPQEDEPFDVSYTGPGIDKTSIPPEALSH